MPKKKKQNKTKISFCKKYQLELIMLSCVVFGISFLLVLDPTDAVPPRISQECCDNWCAKGEMVCHRYTKEYVMCKFPEDKVNDGASPIIDFWVYDTTKLCYSDMETLTGVKEVPFEGEGETEVEMSVSLI